MAGNFDLDAYLSTGPFGDASLLRQNTDRLYPGLKKVLDSHFPDVARANEPAMAIAERCVARRGLDEAFAALVVGDTQRAAGRLEHARTILANANAARHHQVGCLTVFSNLRDDACAASIGRTFTRSMLDEGIQVEVVEPSDADLSRMGAALTLLEEVLPETAVGTLHLAPGVAIVEGTVTSAYINENPYCVLINRTQFSDPALLAETIFHEALHQKMVDIRLSTNFLREGYDDLTSEERGDVLVPWPSSGQPRKWSAARALAAYHVYVHVSVYYSALLSREIYKLINLDKQAVRDRLQTAFERALYLGTSLTDAALNQVWGEDGQNLLQWLDVPLRQSAGREIEGRTLDKAGVWSNLMRDLRRHSQTMYGSTVPSVPRA